MIREKNNNNNNNNDRERERGRGRERISWHVNKCVVLILFTHPTKVHIYWFTQVILMILPLLVILITLLNNRKHYFLRICCNNLPWKQWTKIKGNQKDISWYTKRRKKKTTHKKIGEVRAANQKTKKKKYQNQ